MTGGRRRKEQFSAPRRPSPWGTKRCHGSAVRPEPPFLAARPSSPEPHRSLWSQGGGRLRGGSWPPALRSAARVQCSSRGPGCRGDSCIPHARTFWRPEVGCFLPVGAARDGAGSPERGRGPALTDGSRDLWARPQRPGLPGAPPPRGGRRPPAPHFQGAAQGSAAAGYRRYPRRVAGRGEAAHPRPSAPPAGPPPSFPVPSHARGRLRLQVCGCVSGRGRREGTLGRQASAVWDCPAGGRVAGAAPLPGGVRPDQPQRPKAHWPPRSVAQSGGAAPPLVVSWGTRFGTGRPLSTRRAGPGAATLERASLPRAGRLLGRLLALATRAEGGPGWSPASAATPLPG